MTIKKILLVSWFILLATASLLFFALYNLQATHAAIESAYESRQNSLTLARELQESSQSLTRYVRQYAVTGESRYADMYWSIVNVRSGNESRPADSLTAPGKRIALIALMKEAHFTQNELGFLEQASEISNKLIELETQAINAVSGRFKDNAGGYTVQGTPDKALATQLLFSSEYDGTLVKIMGLVKLFQHDLMQRLDSTIQDKLSGYQSAMVLLVIVASLWLLAFICFLLLVRYVIVAPILQCQHFATCISEDEFECTLEYSSENEIGALARALRTMVDSLRERIAHAESATCKAEEQSVLVAKTATEAEKAKQDAESRREGILAAALALEEVAEAVSSASAQLSEQIEQSERGSSIQASRVLETATAMEEMNSTVLEVSRNAGQAANASDQARLLAEQGAKIVRETVDSITSVQQKSLALKNDMTSLGEHARSINQIMTVISDIADQTNLLALNAAIEAARAGDAGRGFAVVADEVRKLAEKTMSATSDVSRAILSIQSSADKSIGQVEITVQDIEGATKLVIQSGKSLEEIVHMVDTTADQVRAIATASEQQSATSEEITSSITQITSIASDISNAMKQSAQAVFDLSRQTHTLSDLIVDMKQR